MQTTLTSSQPIMSEYVIIVKVIIPTALGDWFMYVNIEQKTERISINREIDRVAKEWRTTTKFGSLLGGIEDLAR